ncbi:MAG: hypothetical protein ACREF5_00905 [Candidatus Saccharimonadales bacterium]
MEPQDNGYDKPNLPLNQQNSAQWWQSPKERTTPFTSGSIQASSPESHLVSDPAGLQTPTNLSTPQIAGDRDLIENEWVKTAKEIIETHISDPYNQSRAITLLRVDYMKKRYNKDIKIPEN